MKVIEMFGKIVKKAKGKSRKAKIFKSKVRLVLLVGILEIMPYGFRWTDQLGRIWLLLLGFRKGLGRGD